MCVFMYILDIAVIECLPVAQETWVQSQVESYERLEKWYLMLPLLNTHKVNIKGKVE